MRHIDLIVGLRSKVHVENEFSDGRTLTLQVGDSNPLEVPPVAIRSYPAGARQDYSGKAMPSQVLMLPLNLA